MLALHFEYYDTNSGVLGMGIICVVFLRMQAIIVKIITFKKILRNLWQTAYLPHNLGAVSS